MPSSKEARTVRRKGRTPAAGRRGVSVAPGWGNPCASFSLAQPPREGLGRRARMIDQTEVSAGVAGGARGEWLDRIGQPGAAAAVLTLVILGDQITKWWAVRHVHTIL